jgi:orotate phosphoribosyltransferase
MVYVRGEAKDHGKGRRIEGTLYPTPPGAPAGRAAAAGGDPAARPGNRQAAPVVVVVEDLVTTGGGALDAVAGVRDEGGQVGHCLAICTYGFPSAEAAFAAAAVTLLPLCTFDDLARLAERHGRLSKEEQAIALDWRADPGGWARRHGLAAHA